MRFRLYSKLYHIFLLSATKRKKLIKKFKKYLYSFKIMLYNYNVLNKIWSGYNGKNQTFDCRRGI